MELTFTEPQLQVILTALECHEPVVNDNINTYYPRDKGPQRRAIGERKALKNARAKVQEALGI